MNDINEKELQYLLQTHNSVRGEIQQRISQRDNFAIQFVVTLGAVFTLGFLDFKFAPFLFFLLPLVTIFYSVQILYSYKIHDRCNKFLTEEIEPRLAKLLGYTNDEKNRLMWESYCGVDSKEKAIKTIGIRKGFFERISLIIPIISSLLFYCIASAKDTLGNEYLILISVVSFVLIEAFNIRIVFSFNARSSKRMLNNLGRADYIDKADMKNKRVKKAIFIDRDGTIHVDKVNTHKIEDLHYFDDTFTAINKLQKEGYIIVIVSNQDGIRKGLYTDKVMHSFNERILSDFKKHGIRISAVYYSPYEAIDNHYSFKPNPGMLLRAKHELNVSLEHSYFIGDQLSDAIAASRCKVSPVIVETGIYKKDFRLSDDFKRIEPPVFSSLSECSEYILDKII